MPIELTREVLFEQVWDRPVTKVAADYGVSDVALKKICDKHRIPVPGRGYWAKRAAGKKVERAHLRAVTDPAINRILIHGSPLEDLPPAVKEAKVAARQRETQPENKVKVIAVPEVLHPAVARTEKKLTKAKPTEKGLIAASGADVFDVQISPEKTGRAIALLHAIVTAAEARGYRVVNGSRALLFEVDDEPQEFRIVERTTRSKHTPTDAEQDAIEKWEKRQQRRLRSWERADWSPRPTLPEWDYTPTGRLEIALNEGSYVRNGLRRTFGDGTGHRLDALINAILEALATWSAAIKAQRVEDERRRQEWEEQTRRREEQQRRNALENRRIETLSKHMDRWHERGRVLKFIAAVEAKLSAGEYENAEPIWEWINWAKGYAERLDPLNKGLPRLLQFEDFSPWELR